MEGIPDQCSTGASFAPGGPIFVPDLISPITSVFDFKSSLLSEISSLEAELDTSTADFDDELSVDELKVFSEEELVEIALKEGFEDDVENADVYQNIEIAEEVADHPSISRKKIVCLEDSTSQLVGDHPSISGKEMVCLEDSTCQLDGSLSNKIIRKEKSEKRKRKKNKENGRVSDGEGKKKSKKGKKRGRVSDGEEKKKNKKGKKRGQVSDEVKKKNKKSKKKGRVCDRESRAAQLEGNYLIRVEELAQLKQKQDKDKLQVRLHSFSGSSKSMEVAKRTSQKNETMRSLRSITHPIKKKFVGSQKFVPFYDQHEVLLFVEFYHNRIASQKTQEFLVLGSQLLSDLRDNIHCLTDKLMQCAEEHVPSGYFLIEDTFCNDLRDPSAVDYSLPIFDWLQNNKEEAIKKWEFIVSGELKKMQKELLGNDNNLPNFKSVHMEKTRFCDLRFRLGAGYLYCHQGNCKHLMVIRDMRLADPEDEQNQADYPLLTYGRKNKGRVCSVCNIFVATKMTIDDEWAEKSPCYFCIKCYFLLHYKEDGSILYPHSAFDYFND